MTIQLPEEESLKGDEALDVEGIVRLQRSKLAAMLQAVLPTNRFYGRKYKSLNSGRRFDDSSFRLDALPFTTRRELQQDQIQHPPYGSHLTYPVGRYRRLHQTSGTGGQPLYWLDTAEDWTWMQHCWETIYEAAGVGPGDRLFFPFSFGPFLGWWGAFDSALALDFFCLSGGGMTSRARLRFLLDHNVTFVCCTPTYALRLAEVAAEDGLDLSSSAVRGLIVGGEPGGGIAATRCRIESSWGARLFDHAGLTEVGPWGFECGEAPGGQHVLESEYIAEVIDAETSQPVGDGELGELVLTNLGRWGSPLIRYRTGDLVRLIRRRCACGRWYAWVDGGILGRTDEMIVIRGNNVFPTAIEGIIREFPEITEFAMEVDQPGPLAELRIRIEPGSESQDGAADLGRRVTERIRHRLHFRPRVTLAEPGSLPRFEMKAKRLIRP